MTPDRPIVHNQSGPSASVAVQPANVQDLSGAQSTAALDDANEGVRASHSETPDRPDGGPVAGEPAEVVDDPRQKAEMRAEDENRGLANTIKQKVGTHPIGTAVGAAGGAAAGAVAGMVAGPVGSLAGAALGAVMGSTGGAVGGTGPAVTAAEDAPPLIDGLSVEDHRLAFHYGADGHAARNGRTWEEAEPDLAEAWERARGISKLTWEEALPTVRQAWQELESVTRLPDGGGRYV